MRTDAPHIARERENERRVADDWREEREGEDDAKTRGLEKDECEANERDERESR